MQVWNADKATGHTGLTRLHYVWALLLVFLGGAFVRIYHIGNQIVIDDEWHALNAVQYHDFKWILTHFGAADHSIPLALLYELQYQLFGLNEILMRWPMLVTGCAAILLLPYMLRFWLTRPERLMLAMLLAISPVLIYYSRFARPYGILVVLEFSTLLLAWHWWRTRQVNYAVGWVLLAALSAWLNTPALIVVTAPFVWFGWQALINFLKTREWADLGSLVKIGIAIVLLLIVLNGPALLTEPGAIFTKAGRHFINLETLPWALSLASGSGHAWVVILLALLALLGFSVLFHRDRLFASFLASTAVAATLVLILTGAAFALHGNVFLRYLVGLLPIYLVCVSIGIVRITSRAVQRYRLPSAATVPLLLFLTTALVLAGPVKDWPSLNNQFFTHQNYHFNFDPRSNIYRTAMDDWFKAEDFYLEIAESHAAGETVIVEAPWSMESYSNPLNRLQEIHHQRILVGFVNGLCAGPRYGELTIGQDSMKFRNFVYLRDLLNGSRTADYLVLHSQLIPGSPVPDMNFAQCEQALRARFGEPWRETGTTLVFKLIPAA